MSSIYSIHWSDGLTGIGKPTTTRPRLWRVAHECLRLRFIPIKVSGYRAPDPLQRRKEVVKCFGVRRVFRNDHIQPADDVCTAVQSWRERGTVVYDVGHHSGKTPEASIQPAEPLSTLVRVSVYHHEHTRNTESIVKPMRDRSSGKNLSTYTALVKKAVDTSRRLATMGSKTTGGFDRGQNSEHFLRRFSERAAGGSEKGIVL